MPQNDDCPTSSQPSPWGDGKRWDDEQGQSRTNYEALTNLNTSATFSYAEEKLETAQPSGKIFMKYFLVLILTIHTVVSFITLKDASILSVFPPFRDQFVYQIFSDLVSAFGMIFLLCFLQLRKKNRPYTGLVITMVCTAVVGSFAPILYLLKERELFD